MTGKAKPKCHGLSKIRPDPLTKCDHCRYFPECERILKAEIERLDRVIKDMTKGMDRWILKPDTKGR